VDKKLLIYTCASGRYLNYVDLWQFCIEHEYPEYGSKILSADDIGYTTYASAVARYILNPCEPIFDYYYITDVDLFIVREKNTLFEYHLFDIEEGQCFSNSMRTLRERRGDERVTGLHFFRYDWYCRTIDARKKYRELLFQGVIGHNSIDDELTLAKIIVESGMRLPSQKPLVERHHGIHLGTVRGKQKLTINERNNLMRRKINKEKALRWAEITSTKIYQNLYRSIKTVDIDAAWQLSEVERFCRQKANSK
jgi:hypothetical protein